MIGQPPLEGTVARRSSVPSLANHTMEPSRAGVIARRASSVLFGAVVILFILGPLAWLAVRAFSGQWTYPDLLPSTWTLKWWGEVFSKPGLASSIELSLIITPVVTFVSMVICLPTAYALARYSFPGRQVVLVVIFATNAFPKFGLFVTMASLFYSLNLMSTFVGVVVVQLIGTIVFMVWIPAAAFGSVPISLEEAARDAGASAVRIFFRVTLPLAAPAILVAVILSFLAAFDEAQGTFLVGAPSYVTMPIQMYSLIGNYPDQVSAVFSILLSIPSVLLLLAVRKRIMGGAVAQGFQLR
jgi:putative spermidine/putrescine transport system permease protein